MGLARRGQIVVGTLTLAAHLLAIALILHQANIARPAIQPPVAVFVSLVKDVPPPPPPRPALKRIPVPVPAVELPLPQFSTAPDFGGGPPPLATGDPVYLAQVQAYLASFSASRAKAASEQMTVRLQLIVDVNGNVLFSHIEKNSGPASLEAQILTLIQNAQPLPPVPENLHTDRVYLVVPVTFSLPR